jgi:hypothetical protein
VASDRGQKQKDNANHINLLTKPRTQCRAACAKVTKTKRHIVATYRSRADNERPLTPVNVMKTMPHATVQYQAVPATSGCLCQSHEDNAPPVGPVPKLRRQCTATYNGKSPEDHAPRRSPVTKPRRQCMAACAKVPKTMHRTSASYQSCVGHVHLPTADRITKTRHHTSSLAPKPSRQCTAASVMVTVTMHRTPAPYQSRSGSVRSMNPVKVAKTMHQTGPVPRPNRQCTAACAMVTKTMHHATATYPSRAGNE